MNQRKFTYLFELDSVRRSDSEILAGQRALYNEIVVNGNVVVLTFNQLVDSRGFFSLLDEPDYYESIISLFQSGVLRVSQYGDIRTIAQYLIGSLAYEKEFIYSGWPLKFSQRRLVAMMRRSLTFSDLSEIDGYLSGHRSEEELLDLFCELGSDKRERQTALTALQCREILENLYWLLKTVLRLSPMHNIYLPPRNTDEYQNLRLHNILEVITTRIVSVDDALWPAAIQIIRALSCYGNDNRSVYLRELRKRQKTEQAKPEPYQYAEAIVNLAYNYACEISISNISKHYDVRELEQPQGGCDTFTSDFLCRLNQYWQSEPPEHRFLQPELNDFDEYAAGTDFPDISEAVRISSYTQQAETDDRVHVFRYEYDLASQRQHWRIRVLGKIGRKISLSLVCVFIACSLELLIQLLQVMLEDVIDLSSPAWVVAETLLFLFLTELITTMLSKKIPWLESLSDALGGLGRLFLDGIHLILPKSRTYENPSKEKLAQSERGSVSARIDLVQTEQMKRYLSFRKSAPKALFAPSIQYPIAETGVTGQENHDVLHNIARAEELYNYHYGVVYQSPYHTLLVDPICRNAGGSISYYPYERVVPRAGNGVVIIPKIGNQFVLLRQFRHAPRRQQLAFPRGFGEDGLLSSKNAEKELREELHACISKEPVFLGQVSPDSGLTSGCADVYCVELDSMEPAVGEEGIIGVELLTEEELKQLTTSVFTWTDDGFTLSAITLYTSCKETSMLNH